MRTSPCSPALAMLVGIALGGCHCGHDRTPPPPAPSSGSGSAVAAAPAGLELFLNDSSIGVIQPAQIAKWPRLDSLVPGDARKLGTWELVRLQGKKPKPAEISHPSSSFPDMVPAIFPGDGGAPAFGMFDAVELAEKGKPAMREDHLTAIRIKVMQGGNRGQNDDGGGGGGGTDPTKLVVTIKTPAGTTTLTGKKLLGLPRTPAPDNPDHKGWLLVTLLDAAGVKTYNHLVLTSADGVSLPLDKKDINKNSVPFIKLNKSNILRLRVMKKTGEGWNPVGDVRGLTGIEIK
jgi:hypothetical protein